MESPALMRPGLEVLFLLAGETVLIIVIQCRAGNAPRVKNWSGRDLLSPISTHMTKICGSRSEWP